MKFGVENAKKSLMLRETINNMIKMLRFLLFTLYWDEANKVYKIYGEERMMCLLLLMKLVKV